MALKDVDKIGVVEPSMSLDDILGFETIEYATVDVGKGKFLTIRSVTAGAYLTWLESQEGEAKRTAGLRLITESVVDGIPGKHPGATGKLIFPPNDTQQLKKMSFKFTETVLGGIVKLNGMRSNRSGETKAESDAKND